ncbi:hypothetical protein OH77DRAFT_1406859 [Trametes cingulata]|nr:hypothetical protein OH77DRAFT_1406859 [Trametes cingulata]
MRFPVGEFLYYLFRTHDEHGLPVRRTPSHGSVVGRYLSGTTSHRPIELVGFWLRDSCGRPHKTSEEAELMYSPTVPYTTIKHARPALTSMCIQLCAKRMLSERAKAVKGSSGLHGSADGKHGHKELCWADISSDTVAHVQGILQAHQPLTLHLITQLATPKPYRNESGVMAVRKTRPPAIVATEIVSSLNFAHTKFARLLPAARSVLFFACGVPRIVHDYSSRVGLTQSWSATYQLLIRLAKQEANEVSELGQDLKRWPVVRFDNVQQYHKQREYRIGRESAMKVGVAAYAAEALDFSPQAADLDDKLRRIAQNERMGLTVDKITDLTDYDHHETVMTLQWLQTLVTYIPALASHRAAVAELFHTDGAKLRAPCHNQKTRIRPLATVAKNEAVTTELREAVDDFLEQLGQKSDRFTRRIIPMGGDGLTFEKLVQLKNYLQFQDNEFERLDIVMPFLETWHTIWTYLSTVFETHWGETLTEDPSLLGHSAVKINQPAPSNLKKVDYYPALYQASIVLDARMLDCWRLYYHCDDLFTHFEALASRDELPTLTQLRMAAEHLHRRYSSQRAWYDAMEGGGAAKDAGWSAGSAWREPSRSKTTGRTAPPDPPLKSRSPAADATGSGAVPPDSASFQGDRTLAQSILFMSDAMLVREVSQAVAAGDVGRVWNAFKIMIFKFAGSGHTKYCTYLLEMLCIVELESSPALRDAFLKNWLVNPSGETGHAQEGDLLEEHLNLVLEEAIARKGANEWDGTYIREVISPNVYHFLELRTSWGTGVGLAKRRGKHPEPHSRPEIRTLLEVYKETELHLFRAMRSYTSRPTVNLLASGALNLEKKKLRKFVYETSHARISRQAPVARIQLSQDHSGPHPSSSHTAVPDHVQEHSDQEESFCPADGGGIADANLDNSPETSEDEGPVAARIAARMSWHGAELRVDYSAAAGGQGDEVEAEYDWDDIILSDEGLESEAEGDVTE